MNNKSLSEARARSQMEAPVTASIQSKANVIESKLRHIRKRSKSFAKIKGYNKLRKMQMEIAKGFDTLSLLNNYIPDEMDRKAFVHSKQEMPRPKFVKTNVSKTVELKEKFESIKRSTKELKKMASGSTSSNSKLAEPKYN